MDCKLDPTEDGLKLYFLTKRYAGGPGTRDNELGTVCADIQTSAFTGWPPDPLPQTA